MFKTGDGWRERQFWSEVIAYELSKLCGINVPPCFVAFSPDRTKVGALSEIFLGYPNEDAEVRLIHGADLVRLTTPNYDDKQGRPHTFRHNVRICRTLGVRDAPGHWAAMLAFDALIGNTDRHPENWGILRQIGRDPFRHWIAPVYDNGTSLGYETHDEKLQYEMTPDRVERFIRRGTHHVQMRAADRKGGGHFDVCKAFFEEFPETVAVVRKLLDFNLAEVDGLLQWCTEFRVAPAFSRDRAQYVSRLIKSRKQRLDALLTGATT